MAVEQAPEGTAWPDTGWSGMDKTATCLKCMIVPVIETCRISEGAEQRHCVGFVDWSHSGYCR